jgi:hypothetical protein
LQKAKSFRAKGMAIQEAAKAAEEKLKQEAAKAAEAQRQLARLQVEHQAHVAHADQREAEQAEQVFLF